MGIYFDYDIESGKEVENWLVCYICHKKKVLVVEYHIKNGPVYSLYKDARKLFSGYELKIGSGKYLVCADCYKAAGSEEVIISEIIKNRKKLDSIPTSDYDPLKFIEEEIEDAKKEFSKLINRIGELYARREKERIRRQTAK